MTALWTTKAIVAATRGAGVGRLPQAVTGISIDSRTVAPGEAYFAIKGDVHDGHDFVVAALKAGAGLAVVAKDRVEDRGAGRSGAFGDDAPLIVVDDVLAALRDLAAAARARSAAMAPISGRLPASRSPPAPNTTTSLWPT